MADRNLFIFFYSLLAIVGVHQSLMAQCPSTSHYIISTQEEIDNFAVNYPNCTNYSGRLSISGSDITNLIGLQQLEYLGEDVQILVSEISNLQGLHNISNIEGDFELIDTNITDLTGLESLESIGGSWMIGQNEFLTSLSGLTGAPTVSNTLILSNNDMLVDFSGFESYTSFNNLVFHDNDALESVNGLNNVSMLSGQLQIYDNSSLESLEGFNNLHTIGGVFFIKNTPINSLMPLNSLISVGSVLTIDNIASNSLDGLEQLASINGNLVVLRNENLVAIDGIRNINPLGIRFLYIQENPMLADCAVSSICNYLNLPDSTTFINDNMNGCDSRSEIEEACLLGLPAILREEHVLSPNPSNSLIQITNVAPETKITIYDSLGRLIKSVYYYSGVDVREFEKGLYFMSIELYRQRSTVSFVKD